MRKLYQLKKLIYLIAFTLLGLLIGFLLHAALEIWYIGLLLGNFPRYGFGLTWSQWELIHIFWTLLTLAGGALVGFLQGRYWWKRIYAQ